MMDLPELFRHFHDLRERLPWTPLARATPVHPLQRLESYVHGPSIWIKRDDRTSDVYGGGKARKLEFLFGDVLRQGARRVLAFGSVDSRDCLAITAFARRFNLRTVLALARGRSAAQVQRTLQLEHELGAELHRVDSGIGAVWRLLRGCLTGPADAGGGRLPYVIWPRRAALFGALGFVNAAFELKRQIACGILPQPSRIYVGVGTGATIAGLALGCELAGISTRVVGAVARGQRPAPPVRLARRAARHLRQRAHEFPRGRIGGGPVELRRLESDGAHQAAPQQAQGLLRDLESLDLDALYTAPAMAALLDDCRHGRVDGPVLFWHTHAPDALHRPTRIRADALPREFHEFLSST
jgi:D-cysteine desulfhydrase